MPTSSFKNPISTPARKPGPIRKSTTPLDEFHNVRDNPLFWVDVDLQISELDQICTRFSGPTATTTTAVKGLECGNCSDGGRSFSSRRSLSRGRFRNYESEKEIDLTSGHKSKSKIRSNAYYNLREQNNKFARNSSDSSEVLKGRDTWSSRHPAPETSEDSSYTLFGSPIPHSDDVRSTSINPEAEEKTIISVSEDKKISDLKVDDIKTGGILETVRSEVRRAISGIQHDFKNAMERKNSDTDDAILSEITHELGNSNEVDFVRDVRGEYVKELEECEERTRKLRAELAAEEYREIELNEILGDMIPEPKSPLMQKPHPLRKASAERRKISRCLEEEAMAYFDECVSISTFDDSDFSSLEDPPSTLVRFKDPSDEITTLLGVSSRVGARPFESQDISRQSSPIPYDACSSLRAKNTCNDDLHTTSSNRKKKIHFSFSSKSSDINSFKQDVRSYVDNFSKDRKGRDGDEFQTGRSVHQNTSDFAPSSDLEKFLIHKMNYRSRIESGGMLLCGTYFGCSGIPLSSTLW